MNACSSIVDPKVTDSRAVLYLPQGVLMPPAVENLQNQCNVHVLRLPERITRLGDVKPSQLKADGLLYLPDSYVVPGGRFNEMYG